MVVVWSLDNLADFAPEGKNIMEFLLHAIFSYYGEMLIFLIAVKKWSDFGILPQLF